MGRTLELRWGLADLLILCVLPEKSTSGTLKASAALLSQPLQFRPLERRFLLCPGVNSQPLALMLERSLWLQ